MHKKIKAVYVLPFYHEATDTHLFYNYELIREVRRQGINLLVLEAKTLGFFKLFLKLLWARLRGYKNCYVHYSFYGALAAIFSGFKVFYWNRGMPWLFKRGFLEEAAFRFILSHTILVTGPESLAEEYQKRYGVKEYRILSNWTDVERLKPKDDKKPEPRIILFVHRLSERKGADLIVPIAEIFRGENIEFWVVGDGPYYQELKIQSSNFKNIKLLGMVPNKDMVEYFQKAFIYLMPSREEGSPHTLLDAMAAGTPFVASDVGGVKEVISPEMTGFLCPSEDIVCFQKKIRKLLTDGRLYEKVRKEGLSYAKNFDISRGVKEFEGLLKEKLKIFYLANARLPTEKAHGIQLAKMCEAFARDPSVDLELIVPRKPNAKREEVKKFYRLHASFQVTALPVLNLAASSRFGFNLTALSFAFSYFFYLLYQRLKGRRGIIYTIDLDQFSFFLIPLLGEPYFFEVHGPKRRNLALRFFLRHVRGVIANSQAVRKNLIEIFSLDPRKCVAEPNGVDFRMFSKLIERDEARRLLGIPPDAPVALYTGGFYPWKGLEIIIEAAVALGSRFIWYLVGGTRDKLIQVTGLKTLPEQIICVGYQSHDRMPLWLAAADLVLLIGTQRNEYSYRYTSPMKLFEYMAAKKPIIASQTPAIMEIVKPDEVVFYKPDDAQDLARKTRQAFNDLNGFGQRVEKAAHAVHSYEWEKRAERILKFISSSL